MKRINLAYIKRKRLELGYSNEEMAESLGLSAADKYFRRERGDYRFQATELPALAHKLGTNLEKLYI